MPSLKLYVAVADDGPVKIGISKNPTKRMQWLDRRPTLVHIEIIPPELNARDVERIAHNLASDFRRSRYDREWFDLGQHHAVILVKRAVEIARSDDCFIGWSIRMPINPTVKAAIERIAEKDEIEVEDVVSSILREFITSRSST